jgi:AP2 domain/HNH endonuclease
MKEIKLTQNKVAMVDDEDYERLIKRKWFAWRHPNPPNSFYAHSYEPPHHTIKMHRAILNIMDRTIHVDHINGNSLDNRKCNLRVATHRQNTKNAKLNIRSTSGYKGVTYYKPSHKWRAQIQFDGKKKHLGYYLTKEEAAKAYNIAALEHHGEFARLNEIKS